MQSSDLLTFTIEKLDDMKARDIVSLDIATKSSFADFMLVCSGNSKRHVISIAQSLITDCKEADIKVLGVEGNDVGEWSLIDLGDIVVHVMIDETRDLYQLEQLWQ